MTHALELLIKRFEQQGELTFFLYSQAQCVQDTLCRYGLSVTLVQRGAYLCSGVCMTITMCCSGSLYSIWGLMEHIVYPYWGSGTNSPLRAGDYHD